MYTQDELLGYLSHGRRKLHARLDALTDAGLAGHVAFRPGEFTVAEWLLYSMRHVQHHAAQLNLVLRQVTGAPTP